VDLRGVLSNPPRVVSATPRSGQAIVIRVQRVGSSEYRSLSTRDAALTATRKRGKSVGKPCPKLRLDPPPVLSPRLDVELHERKYLKKNPVCRHFRHRNHDSRLGFSGRSNDHDLWRVVLETTVGDVDPWPAKGDLNLIRLHPIVREKADSELNRARGRARVQLPEGFLPVTQEHRGVDSSGCSQSDDKAPLGVRGVSRRVRGNGLAAPIRVDLERNACKTVPHRDQFSPTPTPSARLAAAAAAPDMCGSGSLRLSETYLRPEIVRFRPIYGGGGNRTRVRGRTGQSVYKRSLRFDLARTAGSQTTYRRASPPAFSPLRRVALLRGQPVL
jgi:hypothetical protein